ncbi:MAG: hypothetical protein MJB12_11345 [Firmicutes bacterium]|nr:hypothetical protein [Bacillota bacterium]
MLNSVLETRSVHNGLYAITLEIPEKEFEAVYDRYTDEVASEFITYYLENRGDDAKPGNIQIQHDNNAHIVRIMANLHYQENEHTSYSRHYGTFFRNLKDDDNRQS